jgi:hypothetical protein
MDHMPITVNAKDLESFKQNSPPAIILDTYKEQLGELFLIRNPRFRFDKNYQRPLDEFLATYAKGRPLETTGTWFYFPWNNKLIHFLPEEEYLELRTARNKNLILPEEQKKYYNSAVGVAGLSVGSHAALTITMTGGAKNIKLADPDTVSVSNLNRLRYGAGEIGQNKAELAARLIMEINPYANVKIYPNGINANNLEDFVNGSGNFPKLDILLEGVDNLEMKILLRQEAKKNRVPLIMATDNADGIIVDVERYDLDSNMPLFNGALGDFTLEDFKTFPPAQLPKLATKVAGPGFVATRMLASVFEVGKTLYSWPQLGTAATFTGVVAAYLTRLIVNGKKIKSGKYNLSLDAIFDPDFSDPKTSKIDAEKKDKLLKNLGL